MSTLPLVLCLLCCTVQVYSPEIILVLHLDYAVRVLHINVYPESSSLSILQALEALYSNLLNLQVVEVSDIK